MTETTTDVGRTLLRHSAILAKTVLSNERVLVSTGYKQGYFRCGHCYGSHAYNRQGEPKPIKHKPECPVIVARKVVAVLATAKGSASSRSTGEA